MNKDAEGRWKVGMSNIKLKMRGLWDPGLVPDLADPDRIGRLHQQPLGTAHHHVHAPSAVGLRQPDAPTLTLEVSIDNIQPDDTSKKSLKVLDKKLELLAERAEFEVNINSVIGGGVADPDDAYRIARRARSLGFTSTVGIIHDSHGQLRALSDREQTIYRNIKALGRRSYSRLAGFQDNIVLGKPNEWRCRAGARYLYVCEDGLVHYCSQQRGAPGIPVEDYTAAHIRQAYMSRKDCAPLCTISCVHKVAAVDSWRDPQTIKSPVKAPPMEPEPLVQL